MQKATGQLGLGQGKSSQHKTFNHAKSVHAHRVFDKMPEAPGSTWGGQNFQSGVSLDAREGGEVSLSKEETC